MANETEMIESLIWSKQEYSLAQFIKEYPLPQVVRVVDGYYSENEDTCLGAHQVLALHDIHCTPKIIGNDFLGQTVAIPMACPAKAEVYPLKCKREEYAVVDLKSLYPKIKFVRIESAEDVESVDADDLLKIIEIDKKMKMVKFQNVTTGEQVSLRYTNPVTFIPLLDPRRYSVAEIKETFGFPARVRFLNENTCDPNTSARGRVTSGRGRGSTSVNAVASLGEIVLREETTETTVIATTVGDGSEEKLCIGLPKDLPVNFVVAEGFLQGGGNYEEVVNTLHTNFKVTSLADFDQLNIYQHLNAVKKFDLTNTVVSSRQPPSSKRQYPKTSTKSAEVLLPIRTPHDSRQSLREDTSHADSSGQDEYTYVEFSTTEERPKSSLFRENNNQRRPPDIPNRKSLLSTKYENPLPTSSTRSTGDISDATRRLLHNQEENTCKRISQIPVDLSELTVDDIGQVLQCLNMKEYVKTFEEEMIDGTMLKELDVQALDELNVRSFHRKKLTKFIDGWRPQKVKYQ